MTAPLKIAYVATRFPKPASDGRKSMILQMLGFCARMGEVHFLYSDSAPAGADLASAIGAETVTHLPRPGTSGIFGDLLRRPFAPLQSHLIGGSKAAQQAVAEISRIQPDVVIFDMLRTSAFAEAVRKACPDVAMVLDLDDLLSLRYERMIQAGNTEVLSVFGQKLPPVLRKFAAALPQALLRIEKRLVSRRERTADRLYDGMTMISAAEAEALRSHFPPKFTIRAMPPVLPSLPAGTAEQPLDQEELRFVFIGNAFHFGNTTALQELDRIAGRLKQAYGSTHRFSFHAAGQVNPALKLQHIREHGFVDSISGFLAGRSVLVAPVRVGTGIKLKMLDAFASGVPVVSTETGAESLGLTPGEHFLLAGDEAHFEQIMVDIIQGRIPDTRLRRIGWDARALIVKRHGEEQVFSDFKAVLAQSINYRKERLVQC